MALSPALPSTVSRFADGEAPGGNCLAVSPRTQRPIGQKEVSRLFGLSTRQIRRLQNETKQIEPTRRPGSRRIQAYSAEELARFAASRFVAGHNFNQTAAEELGCLQFLNNIHAEVHRVAAATDPKRFGEIRVQLMLELVVLGEQSPLALRMALTTPEVRHQADAARKILGELLLEVPSVAIALADVIQSGLVSQGVQRGAAGVNVQK